VRPPAGGRIVIDPLDAYPHEPDPVPDYNESMYFSVFDEALGLGMWCRLGNRPNEGYAERTVCVYLPDGAVAFLAGRPGIRHNRVMDAGGLRFEILEPFARYRVVYEGDVLLLEDPRTMADPSRAFETSPRVPARIDLRFDAASPVLGGKPVAADGSDHVPSEPERSFGRAHFDQFMEGRGAITIDDHRFEVHGFGDRDHTWGPRSWQSIDWYRWVHVAFGPDLAFLFTVLERRIGEREVTGVVYHDGLLDPLIDATIDSRWDEHPYHTALRAEVRTESGDYSLEGEVCSLIPLRNRQELDGELRVTRISEAMTRFRVGEREALGMTEYLDQIVDGRPVGTDITRS
jgi:hypothetical protein